MGALGGREDLVERRVRELARDGDEALVDDVARQLGHHLARAKLDRDAALLGGLHGRIDLGGPVTVRHVDDLHGLGPRAHELLDGPDAENDPRAHDSAAPTSLTSSSNARAGSGASRSGRPTTR